MNDFGDKLILAIVSAVFGVVAAILTPRVLDWNRRRILKKHLVAELQHILEDLKDRKAGASKAVQYLDQKVLLTPGTNILTNTIFVNYFKEVAIYLDLPQKRSLEKIHALLDSINENDRRLEQITVDAVDKPSEEQFKFAMKLTHSSYRDVHLLDWHIRYHLKNLRDLDIGSESNFRNEYWDEREKIREELARLSANPSVMI